MAFPRERRNTRPASQRSAVSPRKWQIHKTLELRLLYSDEEQTLRKAAEVETARLREELERLKGKTSS